MWLHVVKKNSLSTEKSKVRKTIGYVKGFI